MTQNIHNYIPEKLAEFQKGFSEAYPDIAKDDPECLGGIVDTVIDANHLFYRNGEDELFLEFINFSIAMHQTEQENFQPNALRLLASMRSYIEWHRRRVNEGLPLVSFEHDSEGFGGDIDLAESF